MTILKKLEKAIKELNAIGFSSLHHENYLGEYKEARVIIDEFYKNLAGKKVTITKSVLHPNIVIDGESYDNHSDVFELRSAILPKGSRSTILNLGTFQLGSDGRLPNSANTYRMNNWMGDGINSYISEDNF